MTQYTPSAEELYFMGQMAGVAMLLPYSGYAILGTGTALMVAGVLYWQQFCFWYSRLPTSAKVVTALVLLLELVPALVTGLGVYVLFGFEYGSRVGKAIASFGGLLPFMENTGHRIGSFVGVLWAFTAGVVAMEVLAGTVGGTLTYIITKAISMVREKPRVRNIVS